MKLLNNTKKEDMIMINPSNEEYFDSNVMDVLETLDKETLQHCIRSKNIAEKISEELQLDEDILAKAALVHDIGKIYIPGKILRKSTSLSQLERKIINMHSYYGYRILKDLEVSNDICDIVLYHHGVNFIAYENIPRCEDKKILEYSKMIHTIDSYEALTSSRNYRAKFSRQEALDILNSEKEHQKDALRVLNEIEL